jgi:hypothetical protein
MDNQWKAPEKSLETDPQAKKEIDEDDPIMSSLQIRMGYGFDEIIKKSDKAFSDI